MIMKEKKVWIAPELKKEEINITESKAPNVSEDGTFSS